MTPIFLPIELKKKVVWNYLATKEKLPSHEKVVNKCLQ